jgi:epoxyqueuosine reductase
VELHRVITTLIRQQVARAEGLTEYREPLVGFAAADDPRFPDLRRVAAPDHMLPEELLPGARTVVSFFLPFAPWVVQANARHRSRFAREWAVAYVETNALIDRITSHLVARLGELGVRAAAEPATHNFDPVTLTSRWSHKSVAVISGLGSLGLHQMIITDAGCAGRLGSLVLDAAVAAGPAPAKERCLYRVDGSCLVCVVRCPAGALADGRPLDKHRCREHMRAAARQHGDLGPADVCGKCAIGPCSHQSAD